MFIYKRFGKSLKNSNLIMETFHHHLKNFGLFLGLPLFNFRMGKRIQSSFFNGNLDEDVHMTQPRGFINKAKKIEIKTIYG